MAPTLRPGDGFLINPFATSPAIGDVIVYESVLQGGRLAVHRVTGGDARGYTTRGDANAVSDQDAGEPYVTSDRIRGTLVSPQGAPLVVPGLGAPLLEAGKLARQAQGSLSAALPWIPLLLLAAAGAVLCWPAGRARPPPAAGRPQARSLVRRLFPRGVLARHLAMALFVLLTAGLVASSASAWKETRVSMVVSDSPPPDQIRSARPGDAVPRELEVSGLPLVPTLVVFEAMTPGARLSERSLALPPGSTQRVAFEEVAGANRGLQEDVVRVWRYPSVLPPEATLALHDALPGAPHLALGLPILAGLFVWWRSLRLGHLPLRLAFSRGPGVRA